MLIVLLHKIIKEKGFISTNSATYLNSLVDASLLEFEKVGRESIYKKIRLIDILIKF